MSFTSVGTSDSQFQLTETPYRLLNTDEEALNKVSFRGLLKKYERIYIKNKITLQCSFISFHFPKKGKVVPVL
jgi:hypothetical protein